MSETLDNYQILLPSPAQLRSFIKECLTEVLNERTPSKPESEIMTIDQAEEFLKIKKSSIYKLCAEGNIPHYKPGKNLLFNKDDLRKWLEEYKK